MSVRLAPVFSAAKRYEEVVVPVTVVHRCFFPRERSSRSPEVHHTHLCSTTSFERARTIVRNSSDIIQIAFLHYVYKTTCNHIYKNSLSCTLQFSHREISQNAKRHRRRAVDIARASSRNGVSFVFLVQK